MRFIEKNCKLIILFLLIALAVLGWCCLKNYWQKQNISSFEDCVAAGYPIQKSLPEQCTTGDGKTFINGGTTIGAPITLDAEIVCLPHKDTSGPTTLECAFGLKAENGSHYSFTSTESLGLENYQVGQTVRVDGLVYPPPETFYDIIGMIAVLSLTAL